MLNYDNWKQDTPDSFDYEEDRECRYCGYSIPDGEDYCSKECKKADYYD